MLRYVRTVLVLALLGSGCSSDAKEGVRDDDSPAKGERDSGASGGGDDQADDDVTDDDDVDAPADDDSDAPSEERPTTDARVANPPRDGGNDVARRDATTEPPKSDGGGSMAASDGGTSVPGPNDAGGGEQPSSCSKANMWKAGDTNRTLMVGGQRRTWILHVPASYQGDKPVPLLIDSHPMIFGTAASQRRSSGYAELADREGFIVAYGDGINNAWNMGPCCTQSRDVDDFGFINAIVKTLKDEGCIDEKRVYAAGYSNGGGLSHYLACKHADVFAAVAPAAFDLIEEVPCMPSRPVSVIMFRGGRDTVVLPRAHESTPPTPYRLNPINFLGPEGTFKKWAEINGCTGEPAAAGTNCKSYTQCKEGVEVTLCFDPSGGHVTGDAKYGWEHMKKYTLP